MGVGPVGEEGSANIVNAFVEAGAQTVDGVGRLPGPGWSRSRTETDVGNSPLT